MDEARLEVRTIRRVRREQVGLVFGPSSSGRGGAAAENTISCSKGWSTTESAHDAVGGCCARGLVVLAGGRGQSTYACRLLVLVLVRRASCACHELP
jgi:hypothetical protein